jgi:hypothetical protein
MNMKNLNNGQIITHGFGMGLLIVAIASPFFLKAEAYDPQDPYGLIAAAAQENLSTAAPTPGMQPYGVDGALDQSEVLALLYLDFSQGQSYEAIKNRFGYPAMRNSTSDFYVMPNKHYAEIVYDASNRAIALRLGDSGQ